MRSYYHANANTNATAESNVGGDEATHGYS